MSRFGKTWLTVALAVPSLMMLGLAVYAVRSGNIGSIWQSGNMASVVLIVSFLLVCSVWFLYRDYFSNKEFERGAGDPSPQMVMAQSFPHLPASFSDRAVARFFRHRVLWPDSRFRLSCFCWATDLYMVLVLAVTVLWPYYVLFVKRIPNGPFALTEKGLVMPHLGSDRPIPWKHVGAQAGLRSSGGPFHFFFFTVSLNIDPHVYPNVRRPRSAKPGDLLTVSYSFPAAFSETKWVILRRIAEFKAKDASAQTRPER